MNAQNHAERTPLISGRRPPGESDRYALLTYTRTRNIGDEVQSIAAWRMLPRTDELADRDFLDEFRPGRPTKLIVNGWFCHRPQQFNICDNVEPLFISFHINSVAKASHDGRAFADTIRCSRELRTLLLRHGPIGARDASTLEFLRGLNIPTYLSGCLTLTLQRDPASERGDAIVLVDAGRQVRDHVRAISRRPIITLKHVLGKYQSPPRSFAKAAAILAQYQAAHLVITSRLHVALPCLAFGTPVMLVGADFADPRLTHLSLLVHRFTIGDFMRAPASIFEQPQPNPSTYLSYRSELLDRLSAFLPCGDQHPGEKQTSAAEAVRQIWRDAGPRGKAEYSWRWLRRSRLARWANIPRLR